MDTAPLLQLGVSGIMLWWFMVRIESRMDQWRQALDRQSRTQLLVLVALPGVSESIKAQSRVLLEELPK